MLIVADAERKDGWIDGPLRAQCSTKGKSL